MFCYFFACGGGGCGVVSAIGGGTHLIGGQRVEAADDGEVVTHDGARASVLRSRGGEAGRRSRNDEEGSEFAPLSLVAWCKCDER